MKNFVRWVMGKPYIPDDDEAREIHELRATKQQLDRIEERVQFLEQDDHAAHVFRNLIEQRQGARHATR